MTKPRKAPESPERPQPVTPKVPKRELKVDKYWLTYYVPRQDVPNDAIGRLCVVETVDGDVAIRVPSRGHIAGTYHLVAIREETAIEENARLKSASPILWQKLV